MLMAVTSQPSLAATSSIALATRTECDRCVHHPTADTGTLQGRSSRGRYLTDADGVVQHGFGVGGVVAAGQLGVAKVRLQQQVGLCVGAVVGVRVDLQGELLSQLAVQLVLVVSDWQLCVLLRVLKDKGSAMRSA